MELEKSSQLTWAWKDKQISPGRRERQRPGPGPVSRVAAGQTPLRPSWTSPVPRVQEGSVADWLGVEGICTIEPPHAGCQSASRGKMAYSRRAAPPGPGAQAGEEASVGQAPMDG